MSITRIYQNQVLQIGEVIQLDALASNHLCRVLRLQPPSEFVMFNGQGGQYQARLLSASKRGAEALLIDFSEHEVESPLKLHLAQSLVRGEKMDFIIQKATELGVTEITPLLTEFCNVKLSDERQQKKLAHWQQVIISACEQCGRNQIPKINPPQLFSSWVNQQQAAIKIILDPTGKTPITKMAVSGESALAIGPEGGFSAEELNSAQANGFKLCLMGPRVLRTETASITALTLLQALYGDLSG